LPDKIRLLPVDVRRCKRLICGFPFGREWCHHELPRVEATDARASSYVLTMKSSRLISRNLSLVVTQSKIAPGWATCVDEINK